MTPSRPEISIVSTLYNSELWVEEFTECCHRTLNEIGCSDFEIIFVDDGSPDSSKDIVLALREQDPRIKLLVLSRNFGHHHAASAGLALSEGQLVFLADCDLEVSPEILKIFCHQLKQKQCDVVYAYQEKRAGGWFEVFTGNLFWRCFNLLSDVKVPINILTERLMTRRYLDALLSLGDKNIFLAGMMYWVGFKQSSVPVVKRKQAKRSSYTFSRKIALFVNAITSASSFPLQCIFYLGCFVTAVSSISGLVLIGLKVYYADAVLLGWTSLVVLLFFALGIITLILGVMGIYLAKVYSQVQGRPLYIVQDIFY